MAGKAGPKRSRLDDGRPDGNKVWLGLFLSALAAVAFAVAPLRPQRGLKEVYAHHYLTKVFSESTLEELEALIKSQRVYQTAQRDLTSKHVAHIGEAVPGNDSRCESNPFFVADSSFSSCHLPSRIDIAKHFVTTGGASNVQESYDSLVPRVLSFIAYRFDGLERTKAIRTLFDDPEYVKKATAVCKGKSVFDPIQINLIQMLPGQELPMHWDVPWFWGATRFDLPQWLLVVMEQSRLWENASVPQIQGVSWLHDSDPSQGGDFFYYPSGPEGEPVFVRAQRNAAVVLDGCRAIHGVTRFKPTATVPPQLQRRSKNELSHVRGDDWALTVDGEEVRRYKSSDFRTSLVWRARCFESEEEKERWHKEGHSDPDVDSPGKLRLDHVLDTLEADLRKRGVLQGARPEPLEFALLLLRTYAKYPNDPKGRHVLGYNVCALPRMAPVWLRAVATSVMAPFCA